MSGRGYPGKALVQHSPHGVTSDVLVCCLGDGVPGRAIFGQNVKSNEC